MHNFCFYCRHWDPEEILQPCKYTRDLTVDCEEPTMAGLCRCSDPVLGDLIKNLSGDEERDYGQWPTTMACDWCGRFALDAQDDVAEENSQPTR